MVNPAAWPLTGGQTSIGLELVQMKATLQVAEHLPGELARQAQAWSDIDRAFAEKMGRTYRSTHLESPDRSSIYPGARGGILAMPWDSFPAVMVMADDGTVSPEGPRFDQGTTAYNIALYIEAIVRSDEFFKDDAAERLLEEGNVDRRAKRTLEALVQCIEIDRSLGGVAPGMSDPHVIQTDPFVLQSTQAGEQTKERVFSLVRAEYVVDNYPSHRDSSTPPPDVLLRGIGT